MALTNRTKTVGIGALCAAVVAGSLGYFSSDDQQLITTPEAKSNQTLSSKLVPDVSATSPGSIPIGNRKEYDLFSWDNFVALNWPVGANGQPDPNKTIGKNGDNSTIWETWMEDNQFLVKQGGTPPAWGGPQTIPASCQSISTDVNPKKILSHATKSDGVVGSFNQAQAGPLIDLNANYVRYEILINKPMYNYMVDNKLYDSATLEAFGKISFPAGSTASGEIGAIMAKAAWKIIGNSDDPSKFHTTHSYIYNETNNSCAVQQIALVGLHISTKTTSAPQWIWSTFEHVDNVPDNSDANKQGKYNFFDPNCSVTSSGDCEPNLLPATPWDPTRPKQHPVQVTRMVTIDPSTKATNDEFQAALREINPKSVWANYMLVGTQYPQSPTDPTDDTGRPFPQFLANTTMETFLQGETPPVSSNCIGCHSRATTSMSHKDTDFTYILSRVPLKN